MMFSCTCPTCNHVNHVDWSWIGREMYCAGCGRPYIVPAPMETIAPPRSSSSSSISAPHSSSSETTDLIRFRCPACDKKYSTAGKLSGQRIRCKKCGYGVKVPRKDRASGDSSRSRSMKRKFSEIGENDASSSHADESAASSSARRGLPDLDSIPKDRDEIPASAASGEDQGGDAEESVDDLLPILEDSKILRSRSLRRKRQEAILGSRSEAMARVSREIAEEEAQQRQKRREQARKRARNRKKNSGYFDTRETLTFIGWTSLFVGILTFLAWGYPDFRFPLGGLLCVMGFIVYLLGWAALKQLASQEGDIQGIVFRIFPPYQWWFVWTRWSEARDYALFFAAGILIVSLGSAVIKTSPAGKRAERSERAYQKMLEDQDRAAQKALDVPGFNPGL